MKIISGIPPKLPPNTYAAVDTEWIGMNQKTLHRPTTGKFGLMQVCFEPDSVYVIGDPKDVAPTLDQLSDAVWIMHNAKFDLTQLRRHATILPRTKLVDIMIMERILWSGYYDHFDLQSMTRRYLREHLEKFDDDFWEDVTEITPEIMEYACIDAQTELRVWNEQKKHITKSDMYVWKEIDLPALWAVMDFQGFRVDSEKWLELAKHHRALADEIDADLPFNPRSPKQVKEVLIKNGFPRLPNTREDTLEDWCKKYPDSEAAKLSNQILESRGFRKLSSTYGESMIRDFGETLDDGSVCFFGNFNITLATTGRMSCTNPHLQVIPVRDTNVFRECFIPKPGNVLVIGDYSQQEIFCMAYLSQDERLIDICNSGKDIYIEMAKVIFGKEITKKDPLRAEMKSIVLGTDYGMSKYGLALRIGKTPDEAQEILNSFFRTFPKVKLWMAEQEQLSKYTLTVAGRKCYLNTYVEKARRNAYNNPIQGTAADIMKKALGDEHRDWNFDCPFGVVAVIHDEQVDDVPIKIGREVQEFTRFHMENSANKMLSGMRFRADVSIQENWSKA